jgi:hypothetical protein
MLRQRSAEQIRLDAIRMGVKKAEDGCLSCMQSYFDLARQNGATQEEIEQALDKMTADSGKGLLRRDLLKMVAIGGLATIAGSTALGSAEYSTGQAQAITAWWGTDSSSQSCCGMPQNFYIGRMGYGVEPHGDAFFFNINAASAAGPYRTYGYWGLVGPDMRGAMTPFDWGRAQANAAWNAWHNGPHATSIRGLTVFADVEPGFAGWSVGNYKPNQAVLNGFLQELFNITPHETWPGLYISPYYWRVFMGQNFQPATSYVLWLTGCHTCSSNLCSPCDFSCNTTTSVKQVLTSTISEVALGGHKPVAWQYWISGCGCGDYNVMTQHATSLQPATSKITYRGC